MVDNTSHQVVEATAESSSHDLGPQSNFSAAGFSNVVAGTQINNIFGPILPQHHTETTLFGSLVAHDQQRDSIRLTTTILSKKSRLQTGRRAIKNRTHYVPYVEVKNRAIKQRLIYLAGRFNFLDRGFAEYFQTVVPSFDQKYVEQRLNDIRQLISKSQASNASGNNEPDTIYLGDLGEFCEKISQSWNHVPPERPTFKITHRRAQEIFEYLQDAFEAPYWELMLDMFLQWRANSDSLSGDIVLKVLESLEREIRAARKRLLTDLDMQSEDSLESLAPILEGIDARLAVLGTVCSMNGPPLRELEDVFTASARPEPSSSEEHQSAEPSGSEKETENVALIALILIFLTAAIVPGYKAFSISMSSSRPGSTEDANFWYLIQRSIMLILGNLVMVIPLLKNSWFSPAYSTMWMFFALSVTFAVISILIYPLVNTGWSSMLAFFGSIASVASVLIMTQGAAKRVLQRIKNE